MSKKCLNCGEENFDNAVFCDYCGNKFAETKVCPFCNAENKLKSKFCKECGKKLEDFSADRSPQNVNNSYWEKRFSVEQISDSVPEVSVSGEQKTDIVSGQLEDKVCPTCNTVNSAENKHCKKCGENLQGFSNINWQKIEPVPEEKPAENSERLHQILRTEEKPAENSTPELVPDEGISWGCCLANFAVIAGVLIILYLLNN